MTTGFQQRLESLSWQHRALALLGALTLALLVIGFWIGFGIGAIENGRLPRRPLAIGVTLAATALTVALVPLLRAFARAGLFKGMTRFDQRYGRMMIALVLLGAVVGMIIVLVGVTAGSISPVDLVTGNFSIGPMGAIAAALLLLAVLLAAMWLYHRAIDDHEERAYLWGSQIAYYFVALAIPGWWLLNRGDLLPPLNFAVAISILFISFIVQFAVWAWFKFR